MVCLNILNGLQFFIQLSDRFFFTQIKYKPNRKEQRQKKHTGQQQIEPVKRKPVGYVRRQNKRAVAAACVDQCLRQQRPVRQIINF